MSSSRDSESSHLNSSCPTIPCPAVPPATATSPCMGSTSPIRAGDFVIDPSSRDPCYLTKTYEVIKKLGDGAYGEVKLVLHKASGEKRALKIMARGSQDAEALINEVRLVKGLSHPNILKIYEFFKDSKNFYIVMECYDGGELFDQIMDRQRFTESDSADLIEQVLSALSYIHGRDIAHRDIKPENILFSTVGLPGEPQRNGTVKLVDFGLAAEMKPGKLLSGRYGTSYYIAPEIIRGGQYDHKCDIWSLGVILFILLTGFPPFAGDSDALIMRAVTKGFHKSCFEGTKVSAEAQNMIINMLKFNPAERKEASELLKHEWIQARSVRGDFDKKFLRLDSLKRFNAEQKLANAVLLYITSKLATEEETALFTELFRRLDIDGNGFLDRAELILGLRALKPNKSEAFIENEVDMILSADFDDNGHIDFDEFVAAAVGRKVILTEHRLRTAFELFDDDKNGLISSVELDKVLPSLGNCANIIQRNDTNDDGHIDYNEFREMMTSSDFMLN